MAYTLAQQLDSVQAAIVAIESGAEQLSAPDGRSLRRAKLEILYRREEQLLRKIARESELHRTRVEL